MWPLHQPPDKSSRSFSITFPTDTWTLTPPPSSPLPPRSFKLTLVSAPAAKAHAEANIMAMNLTIVTSCTIVYTGERETSIKEKEQKRRILNSAQMMYLVVLPFLFIVLSLPTLTYGISLWNCQCKKSVSIIYVSLVSISTFTTTTAIQAQDIISCSSLKFSPSLEHAMTCHLPTRCTNFVEC